MLVMFPTSVIDSMARGDILQVVIFSTFFGVALAAVGGKGQAVLEVLESTAQVMFKVTGYVMMFAPIGVFAAIASTVGGKGLGILFTLGKVVALMYAGLAIFVLIVLGSVSYIIRVPFFTFVRAIREPFLIAFSTASSEAALPKAMDIMDPPRPAFRFAGGGLVLQERWPISSRGFSEVFVWFRVLERKSGRFP